MAKKALYYGQFHATFWTSPDIKHQLHRNLLQPRMPKLKLTDKGVRGLKPGGEVIDYWDTILPGFAVRVGTSGAKSFFVGVRIKGKYKRITLKPQFPNLELAAARNQARQVISDAQAGISPEVRKRREDKGTFKAVADAFMQDFAKNHRTAREMQRKIDVELRGWHEVQIADITRADIKELLRLKARGLERGTAANRLLALISKIFNWAVDEEIIDASPALRLKRPAEEIERERVLSADEIRGCGPHSMLWAIRGGSSTSLCYSPHRGVVKWHL